MSTFSHYTYTPPSLLLRLRRWCRENRDRLLEAALGICGVIAWTLVGFVVVLLMLGEV